MRQGRTLLTRRLTLTIGILLLLTTMTAALDSANSSHHTSGILFIVRDGSEELNQFWRENFVAHGWNYYGKVSAEAHFAPTTTACGETSPQKTSYCFPEHKIYYNPERFDWFRARAAKALQSEGNGTVLAILAHEWGHAVQHQLSPFMLESTKEIELQADCLAGAFFGKRTGRTKPQEIEEALFFFANTGDSKKKSGLDFSRTHGEPAEQIAAFWRGYRFGVNRCELPNQHWLNRVGYLPNRLFKISIGSLLAVGLLFALLILASNKKTQVQ